MGWTGGVGLLSVVRRGRHREDPDSFETSAFAGVRRRRSLRGRWWREGVRPRVVPPRLSATGTVLGVLPRVSTCARRVEGHQESPFPDTRPKTGRVGGSRGRERLDPGSPDVGPEKGPLLDRSARQRRRVDLVTPVAPTVPKPGSAKSRREESHPPGSRDEGVKRGQTSLSPRVSREMSGGSPLSGRGPESFSADAQTETEK